MAPSFPAAYLVAPAPPLSPFRVLRPWLPAIAFQRAAGQAEKRRDTMRRARRPLAVPSATGSSTGAPEPDRKAPRRSPGREQRPGAKPAGGLPNTGLPPAAPAPGQVRDDLDFGDDEDLAADLPSPPPPPAARDRPGATSSRRAPLPPQPTPQPAPARGSSGTADSDRLLSRLATQQAGPAAAAAPPSRESSRTARAAVLPPARKGPVTGPPGLNTRSLPPPPKQQQQKGPGARQPRRGDEPKATTPPPLAPGEDSQWLEAQGGDDGTEGDDGDDGDDEMLAMSIGKPKEEPAGRSAAGAPEGEEEEDDEEDAAGFGELGEDEDEDEDGDEDLDEEELGLLLDAALAEGEEGAGGQGAESGGPAAAAQRGPLQAAGAAAAAGGGMPKLQFEEAHEGADLLDFLDDGWAEEREVEIKEEEAGGGAQEGDTASAGVGDPGGAAVPRSPPGAAYSKPTTQQLPGGAAAAGAWGSRPRSGAPFSTLNTRMLDTQDLAQLVQLISANLGAFRVANLSIALSQLARLKGSSKGSAGGAAAGRQQASVATTSATDLAGVLQRLGSMVVAEAHVMTAAEVATALRCLVQLDHAPKEVLHALLGSFQRFPVRQYTAREASGVVWAVGALCAQDVAAAKAAARARSEAQVMQAVSDSGADGRDSISGGGIERPAADAVADVASTAAPEALSVAAAAPLMTATLAALAADVVDRFLGWYGSSSSGSSGSSGGSSSASRLSAFGPMELSNCMLGLAQALPHLAYQLEAPAADGSAPATAAAGVAAVGYASSSPLQQQPYVPGAKHGGSLPAFLSSVSCRVIDGGLLKRLRGRDVDTLCWTVASLAEAGLLGAAGPGTAGAGLPGRDLIHALQHEAMQRLPAMQQAVADAAAAAAAEAAQAAAAAQGRSFIRAPAAAGGASRQQGRPPQLLVTVAMAGGIWPPAGAPPPWLLKLQGATVASDVLPDGWSFLERSHTITLAQAAAANAPGAPMSPGTMSSVVWAAGQLGCGRRDACAALLQAFGDVLPDGLSMLELSRLLLGFGRAGFRPDNFLARLQPWLQDQLDYNMIRLAPSTLTNLAHGLALMGGKPVPVRLLDALWDNSLWRASEYAYAELARCVWSFAALGHRREGQLAVLVNELVSEPRAFPPAALADAAEALHRLGQPLPPGALESVAVGVMCRLAQFDEPDMVRVLEAAAACRSVPKTLVVAAQEWACTRAPALSPAALAAVAFLFARAGYLRGSMVALSTLQAAEGRVLELLAQQRWDALQLARLAWAYGALGHTPGPAVVRAVVEEAERKLLRAPTRPPDLTVIRNLMWGLAALDAVAVVEPAGLPGGSASVRAATATAAGNGRDKVAGKVREAGAADGGDSVGMLGQLEQLVAELLRLTLAEPVEQLGPRAASRLLTALVYYSRSLPAGCAALQRSGAAARRLVDGVLAGVGSISAEDAANVMRRCVQLGCADRELLVILTKAAAERARLLQPAAPQQQQQQQAIPPPLQPRQLADLVWSYGAAKHDPGSNLLDRLGQMALAGMGQFGPDEVADLMWGYAQLSSSKLLKAAPRALVVAAAARTQACLPGFGPTALADAAWSLLRLGHRDAQLTSALAARAAELLPWQQEAGRGGNAENNPSAAGSSSSLGPASAVGPASSVVTFSQWLASQVAAQRDGKLRAAATAPEPEAARQQQQAAATAAVEAAGAIAAWPVTARQVCSLLSVFAVLGVSPSTAQLHAAAQRLQADAATLGAEDVATAARAFAGLRYLPQALLTAWEAALCSRMRPAAAAPAKSAKAGSAAAEASEEALLRPAVALLSACAALGANRPAALLQLLARMSPEAAAAALSVAEQVAVVFSLSCYEYSSPLLLCCAAALGDMGDRLKLDPGKWSQLEAAALLVPPDAASELRVALQRLSSGGNAQARAALDARVGARQQVVTPALVVDVAGALQAALTAATPGSQVTLLALPPAAHPLLAADAAFQAAPGGTRTAVCIVPAEDTVEPGARPGGLALCQQRLLERQGWQRVLLVPLAELKQLLTGSSADDRRLALVTSILTRTAALTNK